jgi:hypothetical protein
MVNNVVSRLSNDDLVRETKQAAVDERGATARLVALLAEFDARKLYLGQGCASLFAYCTGVLHLSEHAAYHRIEAARAAHACPLILERLASGAITLTAIGLLRPLLTAENHRRLLDDVAFKSKRDVERVVASLAPKSDAKPLVRRIPVVKPLSVARSDTEASAAVRTVPLLAESEPASSLVVPAADRTEPEGEAESASCETRRKSPAAADRYLLRVTIDGETQAKLQRARDLLRHSIPSGDPAAILDRALTLLVNDLERRKMAASPRPRNPLPQAQPKGRHVPAPVRRAVWARDDGRCTFVGAEGRCAETGRLEFHHVTPYARGGPTNEQNLTLRCRAHNAFEARLVFGDRQPWPIDSAPR